MKLNSEQSEALGKVAETVTTIQHIHRKHRVALLADLGSHQQDLVRFVAEAVEAGVPKRQVQVATGITSTSAFYELLREAGVPIAERPANVRRLQVGSITPAPERKLNPMEGWK